MSPQVLLWIALFFIKAGQSCSSTLYNLQSGSNIVLLNSIRQLYTHMGVLYKSWSRLHFKWCSGKKKV